MCNNTKIARPTGSGSFCLQRDSEPERDRTVWLVSGTLILLEQCINLTITIMKTLKCDMCDHEASAETFEEWMEALKPHYSEVHVDFMKEQSARSKEEQMAEMQKWMTNNKKRFESQPEDN